MKAVLGVFFTVLFIYLNTSEVSAQKADTSASYNKHQIGFNATESLRLFQRSNVDLFKIHYRYKLNSKKSLRTGLNYTLDTSGNGTLLIDIKAGLDKIFKDSDKWRFYWGGDLIAGYEKYPSSDRQNYQTGVVSFLGAIFYLNEHFSISTEPGLLIQGKYYNDSNTFKLENSESWITMDLINVGQIFLSIHF